MKRPIVCPHCKSKELAFVSEAHKAIVARIFELIVIFLSAIIILYVAKDLDSAVVLLITFAMLILSLRIYIFYTESKTHVQCICKECGNLWLHDSPFNN